MVNIYKYNPLKQNALLESCLIFKSGKDPQKQRSFKNRCLNLNWFRKSVVKNRRLVIINLLMNNLSEILESGGERPQSLYFLKPQIMGRFLATIKMSVLAVVGFQVFLLFHRHLQNYALASCCPHKSIAQSESCRQNWASTEGANQLLLIACRCQAATPTAYSPLQYSFSFSGTSPGSTLLNTNIYLIISLTFIFPSVQSLGSQLLTTEAVS